MRIGKYPHSLVANMDETPAFFDVIPAGSRECIVRKSGDKKKHVTVVLSATADGTMLPRMLIFKGKTDKTRSCAFPKDLLSKRKRSRGRMIFKGNWSKTSQKF